MHSFTILRAKIWFHGWAGPDHCSGGSPLWIQDDPKLSQIGSQKNLENNIHGAHKKGIGSVRKPFICHSTQQSASDTIILPYLDCENATL